jgi:hypothetical protein
MCLEEPVPSPESEARYSSRNQIAKESSGAVLRVSRNNQPTQLTLTFSSLYVLGEYLQLIEQFDCYLCCIQDQVCAGGTCCQACQPVLNCIGIYCSKNALSS